MESHNATITIDSDHGKPTDPDSVEILGGDLVPVAIILAVAVTYCVKYFFAHKTRSDVQKSIQSALERGQALTPDLLDRMGQSTRPRNSDLRRGLIGIALGIGLGAIGLIIGKPDTVRVMLGIGLVPLLVGLAYVALWRFDARQS